MTKEVDIYEHDKNCLYALGKNESIKNYIQQNIIDF